MQVLFVNSREDAAENPGGDNVQIDKTRSALESLGVDVTQVEAGKLHDQPSFDLAHVFNIQTADSALKVFSELQSFGKPVVLSPIYWSMLEHWAHMAISNGSRWRTIARLLGKQRTQPIYIAWQRLKAPGQRLWRTQRQLLRQASLVLPNSRTEIDLLQANFALGNGFRERAEVVVNAITSKDYRNPAQPDDIFLRDYGFREFVLQVGSVNPVKNQLGLIEALSPLTVPLVLIGKPLSARLDYYEDCVAAGRQRGNVLILDRVPHEKLPGIYALAKVHVLPSWRETPGLVSLEAAAAGCQIVTTSIGSAREYFGDLAWYCHPSEPDSIRRAVEFALEAPRSDSLRRHVLSRFTWEKAAQATLAGYRRVLSSE
jgi:glycosyltransferase involved in cell wall biosynthesis